MKRNINIFVLLCSGVMLYSVLMQAAQPGDKKTTQVITSSGTAYFQQIRQKPSASNSLPVAAVTPPEALVPGEPAKLSGDVQAIAVSTSPEAQPAQDGKRSSSPEPEIVEDGLVVKGNPYSVIATLEFPTQNKPFSPAGRLFYGDDKGPGVKDREYVRETILGGRFASANAVSTDPQAPKGDRKMAERTNLALTEEVDACVATIASLIRKRAEQRFEEQKCISGHLSALTLFIQAMSQPYSDRFLSAKTYEQVLTKLTQVLASLNADAERTRVEHENRAAAVRDFLTRCTKCYELAHRPMQLPTKSEKLSAQSAQSGKPNESK